jgi:hypothetical protein
MGNVDIIALGQRRCGSTCHHSCKFVFLGVWQRRSTAGCGATHAWVGLDVIVDPHHMEVNLPMVWVRSAPERAQHRGSEVPRCHQHIEACFIQNVEQLRAGGCAVHEHDGESLENTCNICHHPLGGHGAEHADKASGPRQSTQFSPERCCLRADSLVRAPRVFGK